MDKFARRFHLIAISGFAGFAIHAAAFAGGKGESTSAIIGGALGLVLLGVAGYLSTKLIK